MDTPDCCYRGKGEEVRAMKPEEIIKLIRKEIKGKPWRPLPLPRLLTKRAVFV